MTKIYTAGGFHSKWHKKIQDALSRLILEEKALLLDPLEPELDENGNRKQLPFEEFTFWDLWAIRTADVVSVYSERTNPGQGYIVEAGYAKGLGKTVILVREDDNQKMPDKYLRFIDCIADFKTNSLDKGIEILKRVCY